MKKFKFNRIAKYVGGLAALAILFTACEKGPNFREFSYPAQTVNGMSPASGFPTQQITITGKNFGDVNGPVSVYFNGVLASNVVSVTDSEIVVEVPEDAVSGKVSLKIWDHTIDSIGTYAVMALPVLESVMSQGIAANIAQPGDEVWLNGKNFITDQSMVSIDFNGTPATDIVSITENQIKVKAPEGYTAGNVSVTMHGLTLTGTGLAPALILGDISALFLKNYKQPFVKNMTAEQSGNNASWATPADWIVNSAAQNQLNSGATQRCGGLNFGKSDAATTGQITLQAGWGDAIGNVLNNGKMYQTVTLPAGTYSFVAEVKEFGRNASSKVYLVVAKGSEVPNSADVPATALAFSEFVDPQSYASTPVEKSISFTLTETTTVSLGLSATMVANTYLRLNSVKLNLDQI